MAADATSTERGERRRHSAPDRGSAPTIRLYGIPLSHPVSAVRLMLRYKGLSFRETLFPSGLHPIGLWLAGFRGNTVPTLRVEDRRVEGSLRISRALDDLVPRPALFPRDPERRRRVERAEQWAAEELQEPARRMIRWSVVRYARLRRELARQNHLPWVRVFAIVLRPLAVHFANRSRADDAQVLDDLHRLPGRIRQVEHWIREGRIGTDEPNAADFQIATSLRLLLAFDDLGPLFADTQARRLAIRHQPEFPVAVGHVFPGKWLRAAGIPIAGSSS